MPDLFHEGGLTMPIKMHVAGKAQPVSVPDFSYHPNDSLAQMIVDMWVDQDYRDALLDRDSNGRVTDEAARLARISLAERGIYLERAVVIKEDEYWNDYTTQDDKEVVFVLPRPGRVTPRPGQSLLETARLLMATTPNGI
jgi:hypothetical protein